MTQLREYVSTIDEDLVERSEVGLGAKAESWKTNAWKASSCKGGLQTMKFECFRLEVFLFYQGFSMESEIKRLELY